MTSPGAGLYCPVCGSTVDRLWLWEDPETSRARIFCAACESLPAYRELDPSARREVDFAGLGQWAALRLLHHVREKELGR